MRRVRVRWRTTFGSWVGSMTVRRVQSALAEAGHPVTTKAIYHWLSGSASPRLGVARALILASAGRVNMDDLLHHREEATRAGIGAGGSRVVAGGAQARHRRD